MSEGQCLIGCEDAKGVFAAQNGKLLMGYGLGGQGGGFGGEQGVQVVRVLQQRKGSERKFDGGRGRVMGTGVSGIGDQGFMW